MPPKKRSFIGQSKKKKVKDVTSQEAQQHVDDTIEEVIRKYTEEAEKMVTVLEKKRLYLRTLLYLAWKYNG